jgi:hypothetical protein
MWRVVPKQRLVIDYPEDETVRSLETPSNSKK